MTVVPQTYTATATWTAVQLADTFKQAFIDAGLMTDWFDSFLSGTIENRILRVINNGAKTYGTVYYWFMFTTGGAFVATTNTWNATTHVPTGTQYIDYFSTTTNATTNHVTLLALTSTTTCTVTRYTSGINSAVSFFLIRNGSSNICFMLSHPSFNAQSFVDQDKVQFNNLLSIAGATSANTAQIAVAQLYSTRSSYLGAMRLNGNITLSAYTTTFSLAQFTAFGNVSAANNWSFTSGFFFPVAENNTNTALAADHIPMFTAPSITPYMAALPSDFGFAPYYAGTTMAVQDTFVISAGTEEWEMMAVAVIATAAAGKVLFCARTV